LAARVTAAPRRIRKSCPITKDELKVYVQQVKNVRTEKQKIVYFLEFYKKISSSDLVPFMETKFIPHGRVKNHQISADLSNNRFIVEFEPNTTTRLEGALRQLEEYVAEYWNQHGKTDLDVFVTDCVIFVKYRIKTIRTPLNVPYSKHDIELIQTESLNLEDMTINYSNQIIEKLSLSKTVDKLLDWFKPGYPMSPTPNAMSKWFGNNSFVFKNCLKFLKQAKEADYKIQYVEWKKYLSVVYGTEDISQDIFLRHTYLATLAKAIVFLFVLKRRNITKNEKNAVLEGGAFEDFGIKNFLVEDFFSWVAKAYVHKGQQPIGFKLLDSMLEAFRHFDLNQLDQDVLKDIYQNVAEPKDRHDLGEFYTPDWLAECIIEELITNPDQRVLDPSCGSGSFLAAAIRKISKMNLPKDLDLVNHIVEHVIGIDIHPIAVIFSKANYLLALKQFSKNKAITIPVYLADSINFPKPTILLEYAFEDDGGVYVHTVTYYEKFNQINSMADSKMYRPKSPKHTLELAIPKQIIESSNADNVIDDIQKYAKELANSHSPSNVMEEFSAVVKRYNINKKNLTVLAKTTQTLSDLIQKKQDSIHAFILKNIYKPAILDKFDIIIGNPPWIVYSTLGKDRQNVLKKYLQDYQLLLPNQQKLFTSSEIATLFFVRCVDLYLKQNGKIGFVMPRSVFNGDQHHKFRIGAYNTKVPIEYNKIYDMGKKISEVKPLFSIPSCVLFGTHILHKQTSCEIPVVKFSAKLPTKNLSMNGIKKISGGKFYLNTDKSKCYVFRINNRSAFVNPKQHEELKKLRSGVSAYKQKFFQGASIVPRFMWQVEEPPANEQIGRGTQSTPFRQSSTDARKHAKKPWDNKIVSGQIESKYIFSTICGQGIIPFAYKNITELVLPIVFTDNSTNYTILDSASLAKRGDIYMKAWMKKCEGLWLKHRGKSKSSLSDYINFNNKLSKQHPNKKNILLYNGSGSYVSACLVDLTRLPHRFVADTTTYYFYPRTINEGMYLCAVLNSRYLLKLLNAIKSERHIHTKLFEFPIPEYESTSDEHNALVTSAKICSKTINNIAFVDCNKKTIETVITKEMNKVDLAVKKLLQKNGSVA